MSFVRNKKGCLYSTGKYLTEYSRVTKINSVRIISAKRSPFERFVCGIVMLTTFLVCFSMITKVYVRYYNAPIVINFATHYTSIDKIPFPAVTICPETKSQANIFSYKGTANKIKNKTEVSEFEKKAFEYLYLICRHLNENKSNDFDDKYYTNDFYKTIDQLSPKFEEVLDECQWMFNKINCSRIFTPIFIDQGVCYSFNLLDKEHLYKDTAYIYGKFFQGNVKSNNWRTDENGRMGYTDFYENQTYPRRVFMSGREHSLAVKMRLRQSDFDIDCKLGLQGFRVVIDNPFSIPQASNHYFRLSPHGSSLIAVTPKMTVTTSRVKEFSANFRNCYMETERPLKYFKAYSRRKCFLECMSNYTLRRCECIHYFMPKEQNTSICGASHYKCVADAVVELRLLEIHHKQNHGLDIDSFCDCLPVCEELEYEVEVASTARKFSPHDGFTEATLIVNFKSDVFLKRVRSELFSTGDLVGKFGGLLSIFTGMSVITVVEIIYFLSIRLICNRYLYGLWTGPDP